MVAQTGVEPVIPKLMRLGLLFRFTPATNCMEPRRGIGVSISMKMLVPNISDVVRGSKVPCECLNCKKPFFVSISLARRGLKGTKRVDFCSVECSRRAKTLTKSIICKNCGESRIIQNSQIGDNNFCSRSCSATFNNHLRKITNTKTKNCENCKDSFSFIERENPRKFCSQICTRKYKQQELISNWKDGSINGWTGKTIRIKVFVRRYLFDKYENKCCKCGWSQINPTSKSIPLEVNHIDGDALNCSEDNLELICPNCHSLTPNFRRLNKSGKRNRS